jgi:hypothetical protein
MSSISTNTFIENFLKKYGSEELIDEWKDTNNQTKFKGIFTSTKGKKSKKDPKLPKKNKSSYLFFFAANRQSIKEKYPDIEPKDIMSKIGVLWKQCKEDGKDGEYIKEASNDKQRFMEEMEEYKPSEGFKEKSKKDPTLPKKNKSAWLLFCADKRKDVKEKQPNIGPKNIMSELGVLWKQCKEEDGLVEYNEYFEKAKKDKYRYKKDMEKYNSKSDEDTEVLIVKKKKKKKTR